MLRGQDDDLFLYKKEAGKKYASNHPFLAYV